ncbi:hypothetical protein V2W45_1339489 [Cenococcum geophilum]
MRRARLLDRSLLSSVTDNEYMDTDSDGDSYGTEPTVFDSNANSDADSNADCDADSGINCDADSIAESNDACEAPA